MKIEIKGYQAYREMEDDAYSYSVYADKKRVADVSYGGTGGPTEVQWLVPAAQRDLILAYVQPIAVAREEQSEREERAKAAPGATKNANGIEWGWWTQHLREDTESALLAYLDKSLEEIENARESARILASLRRAAKTKILCRKIGETRPGMYSTLKLPPTPENLRRAETSHPGVWIRLNERPESEWLGILGL